MRTIILILLFTLLSFYTKAQNSGIDFENRIIKVKLVKTISYDTCRALDLRKNAIVIEFDVILPEDKKVFGDKIFAAVICENYPGEGIFNREYDWDLKIYERQRYKWQISILNEDLFENNVNKKKYWVEDISRKITIYYGPKVE